MNTSATLVLNDLAALPDCELVSSAIAGREAGFEELVRRYQRPIAAYIYRMVSDYDAAIDFLRRHAVREHALAYGTDGEPRELLIESRRLTPEQESEREERRAEIESVVRLLPAAYRELIVLRHSHDLSYDEIAEVTGLPLGTVKNRLFRAREAMRSGFVRRGITGI